MRRITRSRAGVLGCISRPSAHALQQRRELMPLIVGGIAIFAAGTVLNYGYRALKAMEENNKDPSESPAEAAEKEGSRHEQTSSTVETTAKRKSRKIPNSIGFDIGSSNARVATRSNSSVAVLINSEGKRQTPVELLVSSFDGQIVAGHIAKMQRWAKPGIVSSSVHLSVGLSAAEYLSSPALMGGLRFPPLSGEDGLTALAFDLGGSAISPPDAYFRIAKYLCDHCSPAVNTLIHPCVAAVPTHFSAAQKAVVVKALRRTGISDVEAVSDAQCAVAGACEAGLFSKSELPNAIVVVDVGGQLTQISLVKLNSGGAPVLVDSDTLFGVGAEAIDTLLVKDIASKFRSAHGIDLMTDPMALQRLYDAVEGSKLELSNKFNSRVNIPFVTASAAGPIHLDETYSRASFENVASPVVSQISPAIADFLRSALVKNASLFADSGSSLRVACLVCGGGARIACIQDEVAKAVKTIGADSTVSGLLGGGGVDLVVPEEPEELVIIGAAAISKYEKLE